MHVTGKMPGSRGVTVLLDGQRLKWCLEADDQEGYAVCAIEDEHGRMVRHVFRPDAESMDGVAVERRHGQARIEIDTDENRQKLEAAQDAHYGHCHC